MIIAIPSKGRPNKVKSLEALPKQHAFLFVPKSEELAYAEYNPQTRLVPVPDEIRGITPTRNFILDWCVEREIPRVVMVDDDLKKTGWIELSDETVIHHLLTPDELVEEWIKLFDLTEALDFRIWGCSTDGQPKSVYPWKPFIFHTYVTGSCMGISLHKDPDLRFDEAFIVKEDYEMCLRCIKEDGGILGARYLYWANSHWVDEGGCRDYRTQDLEQKMIDQLLAMYPNMIRRVTKGGSEFSIELEF